MNLKINGENKDINQENVSLAELLNICQVAQPEMVSVQLNGEFVDRSEFEAKTVKENDEVDFLYFMGGGQTNKVEPKAEMKEKSFITKILHNKFLKEDPHGSLHMPVYENVAFEFANTEDMELAFQRKKPAHMYSRISNPTVEAFEQRIRAVTEAIGVIAVSSGMAAISNTLMAVASQGDNIVTSKHLFGNTYSLFASTLKDWGLDVRFTDLTDIEKVKSLVDPKTRAIFFETITNPQLEVVDVNSLSDIAKDNNIVLIADTTLTPPYVFKSKDFGVDIELLSSTKFISGGATSVGGIIVDNGTFKWDHIEKFKSDYKQLGPFTLINHLRRKVYRNLGACMSPHTAFVQSIGLETLPFRVDAACRNAQKIAEFLENNPKVKNVNYPGLKASQYYNIASAQYMDKPGSLLTFDLDNKSQCFKFMNDLKLIRRATNLNDNRTLVLHPSSTIFCEYSDELKAEMNVRDSMIRLSVGIEEADDIIEDITTALEGV